MTTEPDRALVLARLLRELREGEWPDAELTQAVLAAALSGAGRVAPATLSSWESLTNPKTPTAARLTAYARFFSTRRSLDPTPHLIPLKELDDEEQARFRELEEELLSHLREPVAPRNTFSYDEGPVVIICPSAPKDALGQLAAERNPNYSRMQQFADLDALIEVFGHVRAQNPTLEVRYLLASEITAADLSANLVVVGGVGWNPVARRVLAALRQVPISQRELNNYTTGDVFIVSEKGKKDREFWPDWEDADGERVLVEDVAMVAQVPNPYNSRRKLTICNGIHSRGVVGAVQALINPSVVVQNERFLASRFPEGSFAVLLRVPVLGGETVIPDITNAAVRLYEWPSAGQEDEG